MRILKAGKPTQVKKSADWVARPTAGARRIVLDIFRKLPTDAQGLTTRQIYEKAVQYDAPAELDPVPEKIFTRKTIKRKKARVQEPKGPPHPEHVIRSVRYLKTTVLDDLEKRHVIEKFMGQRPATIEEIATLKTKLTNSKRRSLPLGQRPAKDEGTEPAPEIMVKEFLWRMSVKNAREKPPHVWNERLKVEERQYVRAREGRWTEMRAGVLKRDGITNDGNSRNNL